MLFVHLHMRSAPLSNMAQAEVSHWQQDIARVGAVRAYADFADAVVSQNPDEQHLQAHLFGRALYQEIGLQGLPVCDQQFSYGCFHEITGEAIAERGLGVVSQLDDACGSQGNSLTCQHGIGHGILSTLGYDTGALTAALGMCGTLHQVDPIGGCYGGVFMEYDMRTMLSGGNQFRMPGNDMLSPCGIVPDAYKKACYFWRPQWWNRALMSKGTSERTLTAAMGKLCAQVVPANLALACFSGIGNITASDSGFHPDEAAALCELTSDDAQQQLACASVAANAFQAVDMPGAATALCEDLSESLRSGCLDQVEAARQHQSP